MAQIYRAEGRVRVPWKNGVGTTQEVARADDGGTSRMLWRLSIADVIDDGPFSIFDGYQRIISVLEGNGMVLTVDGQRSRELLPYDPFAFDGAADTSCEVLGGPILDFNLIYSARDVSARMRWVALSGPQRITTDAETALVFNAGQETSVSIGGKSFQLRRYDCLRADQPAGEMVVTSASSAPCAVIELSQFEG